MRCASRTPPSCPRLCTQCGQAARLAFLEEDESDSREERAFRLWINSLGIDGVYVDNLYDGVRDGLVLLSVMDHVQPGVVEWSKVRACPLCSARGAVSIPVHFPSRDR